MARYPSLEGISTASSPQESLRVLDLALTNPRFALEELDNVAELLPQLALLAQSCDDDSLASRCFGIGSPLLSAISRLSSSYAVQFSSLPHVLADLLIAQKLGMRRFGSCRFVGYFCSPGSKVDISSKCLILSATDYWWLVFILLGEDKKIQSTGNFIPSSVPAFSRPLEIQSYGKLLEDLLRVFVDSSDDKQQRQAKFLIACICDFWLETGSPPLKVVLGVVGVVGGSRDFRRFAEAKGGTGRIPSIALILLPALAEFLHKRGHTVMAIKIWSRIANLAIGQSSHVLNALKDCIDTLPSLLTQPKILELSENMSSDLNDALLVALDPSLLPVTSPFIKANEMVMQMIGIACQTEAVRNAAMNAGLRVSTQVKRLEPLTSSAIDHKPTSIKVKTFTGNIWSRPIQRNECHVLVPLLMRLAWSSDNLFYIPHKDKLPKTQWVRYLAKWSFICFLTLAAVFPLQNLYLRLFFGLLGCFAFYRALSNSC